MLHIYIFFNPPADRENKALAHHTALTANNPQVVLYVAVHHVSAVPSHYKKVVCICYVVRNKSILPSTLVRC